MRSVKTCNGDNRYAVIIDLEGERVKLITNSITIKSQLDQAAERGLLPIATRLKKRDIGGGMSDYVFE